MHSFPENMAPLRELCSTASNMYRLGWNERNGGNISVLLTQDDLAQAGIAPDAAPLRRLPLSHPFPGHDGRFFLVTGTGKCFRNIERAPEENTGLVRIEAGGTEAGLIRGFSDGGTFTSEMTMHLAAHEQRLQKDPRQRVVLHAHPQKTLAMTHLLPPDEKLFTKTIWRMCTECLVILPDGVGVLPWMVSSSDTLGLASARAFSEHRVLIWTYHGATACGDSLDEAFGLLETIEKAASVYVDIAGRQTQDGITDEMLRQIADAFGLAIRSDYLDK